MPLNVCRAPTAALGRATGCRFEPIGGNAAPFDRQHHQVDVCAGLSEAGSRPRPAVRGRERHLHAPWPAPARGEASTSSPVSATRRRMLPVGRPASASSGAGRTIGRSLPRGVRRRRTASSSRANGDVGRHGPLHPSPGTGRAGHPPGRDDLAVSTASDQAARGDDVRDDRGDVVQPPGEHADVVAVAMDCAGAVGLARSRRGRSRAIASLALSAVPRAWAASVGRARARTPRARPRRRPTPRARRCPDRRPA